MTVVLHPLIIVLVDVCIIALQLSRESNTVLFLSTVIDSREEQLLYLLLVDYQYYTLYTVEKWLCGFCLDTKR